MGGDVMGGDEASGGATRFLIERYWPDATVEEFHRASTRLAASFDTQSVGGAPIELLRSTFVPADRSAYWLVAADSTESVHQACAAAGVAVQRVLAVVDDGPPTRSPAS